MRTMKTLRIASNLGEIQTGYLLNTALQSTTTASVCLVHTSEEKKNNFSFTYKKGALEILSISITGKHRTT
jgi:hypothetical protein